MKIILETSRLLLREFQLSDAEKMYELNSDPEVIKYTGDPPFKSVEETRDFLSKYKDYQHNGYGRWIMIIKETNETIGWCGLKLNEEKFVDLGFRLFRKHWNKGYASEAAKACLAYGFKTLNMDFIIGRVVSENTASVKVLEKLGMKYWKNETCHGFEDARYYKITKEEFLSTL
jgi:RimJ/RimL family protein N-acetyltransferase